MEQYFHENEQEKKYNQDDEASGSSEKSEKSIDSDGFDCNICLDPVQDPVVTLCGHLYCWRCIYKWIHNQNSSDQSLEPKKPQCPVCKTEVSQNRIVPLYGRGQVKNQNGSDLGTVIPPRPLTPRDRLGSLLSRRGFQQRAPPPLAMPSRGAVDIAMTISPSPTIGMLGEMVSGRILGELGTPLFATTPNSYNLAGVSTRRARRQAVQADRSLTRIYSFLFCCLILCLLLFT